MSECEEGFVNAQRTVKSSYRSQKPFESASIRIVESSVLETNLSAARPLT